MDHDKLYQHGEEHTWGLKPLPSVEIGLESFVKGRILDVGGGDGRNALFLAEKGFDVTVIDVAPTAIEKLMIYAAEQGLEKRVHGVVADIRIKEIEGRFENVICNFVLHFFRRNIAEQVIQKIMSATSMGGVNLIQDMTKGGPLYTSDATFWPEKEELRQIYSRDGWKVVRYFESKGKTKQLDDSGKPFLQENATVIAIKPE